MLTARMDGGASRLLPRLPRPQSSLSLALAALPLSHAPPPAAMLRSSPLHIAECPWLALLSV